MGGNTYGHPHSEVQARAAKQGVQAYRTDINGMIVVVSYGKMLQIRVDQEEERTPDPISVDTLGTGTLRGHYPGCSGLPAPHDRIEPK